MTENEISYKIRGAIFKVYKELGPGLMESIYEAAMCYQLTKDEILRVLLENKKSDWMLIRRSQLSFPPNSRQVL